MLSVRIKLAVKINDEYKDFKELPGALLAQQGQAGPARPKEQRKMITAGRTFSYLEYIARFAEHVLFSILGYQSNDCFH